MSKADQLKIRQAVLSVLKSYGVVKAAFFGSIVRNEFSAGSDIDLLVEFGPGKSLLDLIGLKQDLETLLGRRVDVLTYKSLHPLLRDRILAEQEVILG